MEDKVIADNFNYFDIFVRFFPGCIIVGYFYYCYRFLFYDTIDLNKYLKLIVYISLSYNVGCLLQAFVGLATEHFNKWCFGGEPRDICMVKQKNGRKYVLEHEATRLLARKMREIIVKKFQVGKVDDLELNHFATGYMINYLELKGYSKKSERFNSLADMCSSVAITIVICFFLGLISFLVKKACGITVSFDIFSIIIKIVLILIGFLSACNLYVKYTQIRLSIIINQFFICCEWVNIELNSCVAGQNPPPAQQGDGKSSDTSTNQQDS